MKIIVGDAKTQKIQKPLLEKPIETTIPHFLEGATILRNRLKALDPQELERIFKVSSKIAASLFDRYKKDHNVPAITMYDGMVFRQFNRNLDSEKLDYYKKHLRIISPLYGLLLPSDGISFYRLSMGDLPDINLYDYHQPVNALLENEDFLLLLCSQEFARLIDHPRAYFVDFVEFDGDKTKRPSAHIKQARGTMVSLLARNRITSLSGLKKLDVDGFVFNPELSDGLNLVFSKKFATKKTQSPASRP